MASSSEVSSLEAVLGILEASKQAHAHVPHVHAYVHAYDAHVRYTVPKVARRKRNAIMTLVPLLQIVVTSRTVRVCVTVCWGSPLSAFFTINLQSWWPLYCVIR